MERTDGVLVALYQAQWTRMVRTAGLMVGGLPEGEDIVAEAFVRLERHLHRLPEPGDQVRYLHTIVVNLCRSTIRRRVVRLKHAPRRHPDVPGVEAAALDRAACAEVAAALAALPVRQRQALVLRFYADLTEREVAEVMGIAVGTVKSTVSRAKETLATLLEVPL